MQVTCVMQADLVAPVPSLFIHKISLQRYFRSIKWCVGIDVLRGRSDDFNPFGVLAPDFFDYYIRPEPSPTPYPDHC